MGGSAASVQAVGAGTIADIWEPRERGRAMGVFYLYVYFESRISSSGMILRSKTYSPSSTELVSQRSHVALDLNSWRDANWRFSISGPLMGPLLAPIIGGALADAWGWRSTQWFLAIFGFVILVFLIFALPETLKARKDLAREAEHDVKAEQGQRPPLTRISSRQEVHLKTKKTIKMLKRAFIDPLKIILYLRYPAVLITVYYASITFGSLYILNISLESTFAQPPYNFTTIEVGLTYIPNSIGYVMASLYGGKWTDTIMAREAKKAGRYDENGKLVYRPEDRMRENAWIAAFMYPAALIWYGWTADKHVYWIVPVSLKPCSFHLSDGQPMHPSTSFP